MLLGEALPVGLDSQRKSACDPTRRTVLLQGASIVGGAPFAAAIYGYAHERLQFAIEHIEVPVANLPAALDKLRIVQLSDIHAGDFMPPLRFAGPWRWRMISNRILQSSLEISYQQG